MPWIVVLKHTNKLSKNLCRIFGLIFHITAYLDFCGLYNLKITNRRKSYNIENPPKILQGFSDFSVLQLFCVFLYNIRSIGWEQREKLEGNTE